MRAALLFAALVAALSALFWLWTSVVADPALLRDVEALGSGRIPRGRFVGIVLAAFLVSVRWLHAVRTPHDLERMRALVGMDRDRFAALLRRRHDPRIRAAAIAGFVLVGIAIIPLTDREPDYFRAERWNAILVWALCLNAATFAVMGDAFYDLLAGRGVHAALVRAVPRIDLLDPAPFRPLARQGLRGAFFWIGGSSIASLLALDLPRLGPLVAVLLSTLGLATWAFLEPMTALRERIAREKRLELERVRARIHSARTALLEEGADGAAAAQLPALLAWEARVGDVREWAFDTLTLVRFAVLTLVATGSWLGGAVVERLLGTLLD